ncbi:MAG: hypothetical protein ACP5SF_04285 [Thermoplasmata archaeon]
MRKKIIGIGIVILLVGVVMLSASSYESSQNTIMSNVWTSYYSGEYVSQELNFTTDYILMYSFNETVSGVVSASSLSTLNKTNLKNFSIKPSVVVDGIQTYELENGKYYIVVFSSSSPNITYTIINMDNIIIPSVLELVGVILAIVGIIIAIIGLLLKKK